MGRKDFPLRADIIRAREALLCDIGQATKEATAFKPVFDAIKANTNRHFLAWSLDNPLQVSYAGPKTHRHDSNRRLRTSLGRYIRRQLKLDVAFSCAQLDAFINATVCRRSNEDKFRIVRGDALLEAYSEEIGGHSCMTGDHMTNVLEVYAANPDKVQLLIYRDGSMEARALLWHTDDGEVCLDRIYPNDGPHVRMIQEYGKKQGWLIRPHNSLPNNDTPFGGRNRQVTVIGCRYWPYLDSFRFANDTPVAGQRITLSTACEQAVVFDDTDGGYSSGPTCCCCEGNAGDDYYVYRGDYLCQECYDDNYCTCENCDDISHYDDTIEMDGSLYCHHCINQIASRCDKCGDFTRDDNLSATCDSGEYFCETCIDRVATYCEECCEWNKKPCDCAKEEEPANA